MYARHVAAASWHSSFLKGLMCAQQSFPSPPPSYSSSRFHSVTVPQIFHFHKGHRICRKVTGLWRAVRAGAHSIAWKVAWDAWVRPWLHGWGCCMSEAHIIWGRSPGKERKHPSGFISDVLWVTDEWRPKAGWPERGPCFPHPLAAERWSGGGGSQWCQQFCILHSAADKRQSTPPALCSPGLPMPLSHSTEKDSVGKRKGRRCWRW